MFGPAGRAVPQLEFDDSVLNQLSQVALGGWPTDAHLIGDFGGGEVIRCLGHDLADQSHGGRRLPFGSVLVGADRSMPNSASTSI